jgi:hypothetical protein
MLETNEIQCNIGIELTAKVDAELLRVEESLAQAPQVQCIEEHDHKAARTYT